MRTSDVKILETYSDEESLIVKTMLASDVVYKDNKIVQNKKLSQYLLSSYVEYG